METDYFGLDFIKKIIVRIFQFKEDSFDYKVADGGLPLIHIGVLPKDIKEIVDIDKYALYTNRKYTYDGVNYEVETVQKSELIGPMINAIKELSAKVDDLEERVTWLEEHYYPGPDGGSGGDGGGGGD